MKKIIVVRLAIALLTTITLSGCLLIPVDDGYRGGGSPGRDGGRHHGDRHGDHGGRR